MKLADQFREIERGFPERWLEARIELVVADEERGAQAAALLGPAAPGRSGKQIFLTCACGGSGVSPEGMRRLFRRLDQEGIAGRLVLLGADAPVDTPRLPPPSLAGSWDAALAALPADWSDLYAEVELRSTDHLDRAALLLAPANPARYGAATGFRFRCARTFGYGISAPMARRCLERLDEEQIRAEVRILRALSDSHPVATQGPVWYVGGRAV